MNNSMQLSFNKLKLLNRTSPLSSEDGPAGKLLLNCI